MPKRFGDRWEVVRSLAEGGQAHTFLVRDLRDGSTSWVLKRLKNPDRRGRFEREIQALTRLKSAHVPQVVGHSTGHPAYLVTKHVGEDLARLREEPLSAEQLLARFRALVVAARDAHAAGLVHRDIKPDNVTVDSDGTPFLVDFGICGDDAQEVVLTTTAEGFGNRAFAAPECEPGSADAATSASDVYSLGKLLFWMAADRRYMVRERFDETAITFVDMHVRSYVGRLVRHTVMEEPSQRWTTTELIDGIDWCVAKMNEHSAARAQGLVVVADGFGPNDESFPGGSRSATIGSEGDSFADHDVAESFSTSAPVVLDRIELALRLHRGLRRCEVLLVSDDDGTPSSDVLQRWETAVAISGEVVVARLHADTEVELAKDSRYWVVLSALEPPSEVAWVSAAIELAPRRSLFAERDRPDDWQAAESASGPGLALRVLARPETG